jgi:predicted  nucleic acid-binding Zn-ribbon protein
MLVILAVIIILLFINLNPYHKLNIVKNSVTSMERVYYKLSASLNEPTSNIAIEKDKYYEENLSTLLSKEELSAFSKLNWKYSLTVNDINIFENSISTEEKDISC